jgi:hypothetical protein
VCAACRANIEALAETPKGIRPFLVASIFGIGAAIAGAAIYYAVIAIANLEVGLIAILTGYMVGYSVRKGAGGRGGRRFQVLGVALTYLSVALAYTPVVIKAIREGDQKTETQAARTADAQPVNQPTVEDDDGTEPSGRRALLALGLLMGLFLALPVMMVVGSLPSGLISAAIIFFGLRQAWRMTGTPALQILGPYRVGAQSASVPV